MNDIRIACHPIEYLNHSFLAKLSMVYRFGAMVTGSENHDFASMQSFDKGNDIYVRRNVFFYFIQNIYFLKITVLLNKF